MMMLLSQFEEERGREKSGKKVVDRTIEKTTLTLGGLNRSMS